MNKFKAEPYITQRKGKNGMWTFQVYIRSEDTTITRSFGEKRFGSARLAYDTAVRYKNQVLFELHNDMYQRPSNLTVQEVFDLAIENSVLSYNTKHKHEKLFRRYVEPKDLPVTSLTKADIINNLNRMVDVASDGTIQRVCTIWKNDIVAYALNNEILIKDLTAGIKPPKSRLVKKKRSTSTDRKTILEVERLLLASNADEYTKKLCVYLIELLYYTGMRPAEAEALTRDDIKRDYITVNKQLGSNLKKQNVVTRCKTDSSERRVPIHPDLRPVLKELLDFSMYDELFMRHSGQYLDSTTAGNLIHRITKGTGIEFNLYRLRHNMATSLVTNGTDTKTTMELLGHSSYSMSLGYANSSDELKEKAIELLH